MERHWITYLQQRKIQQRGMCRREGVGMSRPRGTDSAKVIKVIETQSLRGSGTKEDNCRVVTQYWDFDGNLLAENDPCIKEKE